MGVGVESLWQGLLSGHTRVRPLDLFDVSGYRSPMAARVDPIPRPPSITPAAWRKYSRCDRMALLAVGEALRAAGDPDLSGAALSCGLCTAGMFEAEQRMIDDPDRGPAGIGPRALLGTVICSTADVIGAETACDGPVHTVSTACSSASHAIGIALDLIRDGEADVALAGGADALCRLTLAGFNSLGVVTPGQPRPFDARRDGMALGEGAAFLVLESEEHARGRGRTSELEVCGYASTAEGEHMVHPASSGEGALRSMRWALRDAGATPDQVDHVSAHGTATVQNDAMEARAIRQLLGDRVHQVPVNAIKSAIGHTLGASGALEAVAGLLTLERGIVPPTSGHEQPDEEIELDVVHGQPRPGSYRLVLSNSFAFGGNDVSLVMRRQGAA